MTKNAVTANGLWAPIIKNTGLREWIDYSNIASTRRDAKAIYLEGVPLLFQATALEHVRFARVTITEVVPSAPKGDLK